MAYFLFRFFVFKSF
jgi:putative oxidoreductase